MRIRGALALVTGASSGIGTAVAERLAAAGARVLVHGRDGKALGALAERIGGVPVPADLTQPSDVDRLAERATDVDILVNNAGIGWAGPFVDMPPADLTRLVDVNLTAPLRLTRALLPGMVDRGTGHVVFVTSIAGRMGVPGEAAYAATKAGLDAFAESLRFELRGTGVSVGVLVPGVVDTPFFERRGQPYTRTFPRPLPVGPVADALVRAIAKGRADVYAPRWLRLPVAIRATMPGAYRALAARFHKQ